jgi:hypothetical protein
VTRLTVSGRLTAAEDRTLRGMLVPFGRPGQTNLGRVVVQPGGITVPDDVSALFASLDHLDGRDPVANFRSVTATPDGLLAEWDVPTTHGGDRLLAEFRAGTRTGISVELEPVTIRDGVAAGVLIGCAFPVAPAFPDARLIAELAPDTPDDDAPPAPITLDLLARITSDEDRPAVLAAIADALRSAGRDDEADALLTPTDPPPAGEETPTPEDEEDPPMTLNASAPAALLPSATAHTPPAPSTPAGATPDLQEVFRLMAEAHSVPSGAQRNRLLAALTDIVAADVTDMSVPQWVGELWSGVGYQRRYVPLINRAPLTGMNLQGWRWTTKPEVDTYTGNKAAVPSNDVDTEPVTKAATRWAGAHDIDRKFRDFGDSGFFAAYYAAMAESYARKSDLHVPGQLKAGATVVTAGAVPSGVSTAMAAIVDGALAVLDKGVPTFAIVEKSLYRSLLLTPADQVLAYLNASLSLEDGTLAGFRIVPAASTAVGDASSTTGLDVGEVLVGISSAATFYELGDGTPIRAEAVDMVNGGIDAGVFGYGGVIVHDAAGLALVDTDADS